MIVNASMRSDIVAFYLPWLMNRLKAGYVLVQNPYNNNQISHISLHPEVVDAIVFCTKNPILLVSKVEEIQAMGYHIGCQVTITPYQKDLEPRVYDKSKIILAFKQLSKKLGKEKMIWRYDPIIITNTYTIDYHKQIFRMMCQQLSKYTSTVIISFIDMYQHLKGKFTPLSDIQIKQIAETFGSIAKEYHLRIQTCAEKYDLTKFGIVAGACTSVEWLEQITETTLIIPQNKNRELCRCVQTVEIGGYESCIHGCTYCYACHDEQAIINNYMQHNIHGEMLIGVPPKGAAITKRKMISYIHKQLQLDI